jgi:hypothetical protein
VFARYYQFLRQFARETAYPMKTMSEDDVAIEEADGERQAQVYVVDPND